MILMIRMFLCKGSSIPKERCSVLNGKKNLPYWSNHRILYFVQAYKKNLHYFSLVLYFLLLIGGVEPNPGPNLVQQPNVRHDPLNITHINACSVLTKLDLLELELSNSDIILISETHLNEDVKSDDLLLKGYQKPVRRDRNRHGGGVAIFVKSNIYFCVKPEFNSDEIEILWIEICISNMRAMVGVLYRPPQSNVSYWQKFENNIQPIIDLNIPIFLGGDFNVDMLVSQSSHLGNILTRLNLVNVVQEPTRITSTSATCIDLIITNRPNLILDVNVLPNFCSDHCPVSVDINIKTSKQMCYKRKVKKYDHADFNSISNEIENTDWSNLFDSKAINENYSNFVSILNEVCDKHIPTKTVVIRPDDKPFMNGSIRRAIFVKEIVCNTKLRLQILQIIGHNIDD